MKNLFILFIPLITLFFFSCQTDSGNVGEIAKMEKIVDESPTSENVKELVAKYNEYAKENPDDEEMNGRYMYRAASKQLQTNNVRSTISFLNQGIQKYPKSSATPNSLYLLGETYKTKFRQPEQAKLYYQALVEGFPTHKYAEKAKGNLVGGETLSEMVEAIKNDIYMDSTQTRVNPNKARKLVDLYSLHASVLPSDPKTPSYLYDTYEIANSVRMFEQAATACEKLYKDYPDHNKAATAMFLSGYLYENELRDLDKAKKLYEDFLVQYPDNEFAKDAKFSLENLGKPADQLLEELRKKNEGK